MVDQILIKETKLPMNRNGFQSLADLLNSFQKPEVVFEATGVYSRRFQHFLTKRKVKYVQLNPLKAKKQLDKFRRFKTDRTDARNLAKTQFLIRRALTRPMNPIYEQLRDLNRFYQEVNKDIVAHKNRLHRALQLSFPELEQLFSSSRGDLYWFIVRNYACPQKVLAMSPQEIAEQLTNSAAHVSLQRALLIANRLQKLAKATYSAIDDDSPVYGQIDYLTYCIAAEER